MAEYKYEGLTMYAQKNESTTEKLSVLAEAITALYYQEGVVSGHFDEAKYQSLFDDFPFQFIAHNEDIRHPEKEHAPKNTPDSYLRTHLQHVTIKGVDMVKLYVPAVSKDEKQIKRFMSDALLPVLHQLFRDDFVTLKTKSADNSKDFDQAEEKVLFRAWNDAQPVHA